MYEKIADGIMKALFIDMIISAIALAIFGLLGLIAAIKHKSFTTFVISIFFIIASLMLGLPFCR